MVAVSERTNKRSKLSILQVCVDVYVRAYGCEYAYAPPHACVHVAICALACGSVGVDILDSVYF